MLRCTVAINAARCAATRKIAYANTVSQPRLSLQKFTRRDNYHAQNYRGSSRYLYEQRINGKRISKYTQLVRRNPSDIVGLYANILKTATDQEFIKKEFLKIKPFLKDDRDSKNAYATYFSQLNTVDEVQQTLLQMAQKGIQPNIYCYNNAIYACAALRSRKKHLLDYKRLSASLQLFEEIEISGLAPNCVTMRFMLQLFTKFRLPGKGYDLYRKMKPVYCVIPDVGVYNALLHLLSERGKVDHMKQILADMAKANIRPNKKTFTPMIKTVAKSSPEAGFDVLKSMEKLGVQANIINLNCVLLGQTDLDKAVDLFNRIKEGEWPQATTDTATYNTLIGKYCQAGKIDEGIALLKQALKIGRADAKVGWQIIITAYLEQDDLELALEAYATSTTDGRPGVTPITLGRLIAALTKAGRVHEAIDLYDGTCKYEINITDGMYCSSTVRAFTVAGQTVRALELLENCARRNVIVDFRVFYDLEAKFKEEHGGKDNAERVRYLLKKAGGSAPKREMQPRDTPLPHE